MGYFDFEGKDLPVEVLMKLKETKYDPKWENVSTATKRWKQGVEDRIRTARRELLWIDETVEEEFKEEAVRVYTRNLAVTDVMNEVTRMRKQKEMILAKEREKIVAEANAQIEANIIATKERIAAEERAKAEARRKEEEESKNRPEVNQTQNTPSNAILGAEKPSNVSQLNISAPTTQNVERGPSRSAENKGAEIHTLRIKATPEQFAKIKGYINYCGALCREV